MRQKDDGLDPDQTFFIQLLDDLSDARCSREQYDWLMTKKTPDALGAERMRDFEKSATYLCSINKSVDARNATKLRECGEAIFKMTAVNSSTTGKGWCSERFRGLENTTFLSLGSSILLTTNIWKDTGLVNGQPAIIKDVVYLVDQIPNKSLPSFIVIDCPNYTWPSFFEEPEKKTWVPIVPSTFLDDTYAASRTGYPMRLAYAMTIHKSQGESLAMIWVDIGNSSTLKALGKTEIAPGLTFVALSRCPNHKNICVEPFAYDRVSELFKAPSQIARRQEQAKLDQVAVSTEEAWSTANSTEYNSWLPELAEKKRLRELS
jgi:hypothetical protein